MLKRTKSTFVLQDPSFSSSSLIKKDSYISSHQESNNITFKLSDEKSFGTTTKMPSIFSSQESNFLKACGLCRKKLTPEKSVYMYRGDQSFCSDDCRCRKMLIEELLVEEEEIEEETATVEVPRKEIAVSSSSSLRFVTKVGNGSLLPPRRNHVRVAG